MSATAKFWCCAQVARRHALLAVGALLPGTGLSYAPTSHQSLRAPLLGAGGLRYEHCIGSALGSPADSRQQGVPAVHAPGRLPGLEQAPAAIELSDFSGEASAAGYRLTWTTAQEQNSASFVVEASADGRAFAAVAELPAAGTSSAPRRYMYFDASPGARTAARRYYRLRLVSQDGTTRVSLVVELSRIATATATTTAAATATTAAVATANKAAMQAMVYPNPFASELNVLLPGAAPQPVAVSLLTLEGRLVYAAELDLSSVPRMLPRLSTVPAGEYLLRLTAIDGRVSTQKVTRQ